MKYIQIPKTITYKDLARKGSFSPSSYKTIVIHNKNLKELRELIKEPIRGKDQEAKDFMTKSPFIYLKTKAINDNYYSVVFDRESFSCLTRIAYNNAMNDKLKLQKGDLLYSSSGGEEIGNIAIVSENAEKIIYSSHIFKIEPKDVTVKYYLFAFLKSKFATEQLSFVVPKGATLRRGGKRFLKILIPFPNQQNQDEIVKFVSLLVKAVVRKEAEIKKKYRKIMDLIDKELKENQKPERFTYNTPLLKDLVETTRLDAGMFCEDYKQKQFIIENYTHDTKNTFRSGFDLKRGQNLQVSQIGRSIYADKYKPGFYKLIRPLNLSDYGTVEKYEYLGNPRELQTLNKGEILFSAEGTIGKFCVFINIEDKTITNIHGITVFRKGKEDGIESIFLGLFLGYLRSVGPLDYISVGGQGGSLAQKYWKYIKIPNFPRSKKEELARYYCNHTEYNEDKLNVSGFENEEMRVTAESGIWQLDSQIKQIKQELDAVLHRIIMNEEVEISFDFLKERQEDRATPATIESV